MNVKLTEIEVKNFKSIHYLNLKLENLNILIGANDAGKSNFLDIFRFISEFFIMGHHAFDNKRGGFWDVISKYTENNYTENNYLSFKLFGKIAPKHDFQYLLEFHDVKSRFNINRESFLIRKEGESWEKLLNYEEGGEKFLISEEKNPLPFHSETEGFRKTSILCTSTTKYSNPLTWEFINSMIDLGYFNFRPQILTEPCTLTEDLKLEDNGKNLPTVLQNFYNEFPTKFKEYEETIHNLYSQYEFLRLKFLPPTKIYFSLEDREGKKFPMWILSDGLIKCLCILYLFHSPKPHSILLLEEPEASIHPHLLNNIFDFILTLSDKTQIFIATHSPYFLNSATINDLLYVYKKEGSTNVKRIDQSDIPIELQREFKPGELYYSGFLDPEES